MQRLDSLARLSLIIMGAVALFFALDQVESIFAPLTLALVTGVVLSPISDAWERLGFPAVWGALSSLAMTLVVLAGLAFLFYPLVVQLVDQAPKVWADLRETIVSVRGMIDGMRSVTADLKEAIEPGTASAATEGSSEVAVPDVTDALLLAPSIVAQVLVYVGALFFFLLTRNDIYLWAARHLAETSERATTVSRLRQAERRVSRYFVTITMINAGLGLVTGVTLQVLGMPGALLWGALVFLLNFVVYLGPAMVTVALLFAGIAAFDGVLAIVPAAVFLVYNGTEAQFVTPALVGRQMALNPLLVFVALTFGIWLWGPLGGVVAIPLLLWVLVLVDALPNPVLRASG